MEERKKRKMLEGIVVSDKMNKTVIVEVIKKVRHGKYNKLMHKRKKYFAHDEKNTCKEGDSVRIASCRPFSKFKRWRVLV